MNDAAKIKLVEDFFNAWSEGETASLRPAYEAFLSDDVVYENSGLPTFTSLKDTIDFFFENKQLQESQGEHLANIQKIVVELFHIAVVGDIVFTECVDHHINDKGEDVLAPKIAGVMEIRGDKICAWRDYFDVAAFAEHA